MEHTPSVDYISGLREADETAITQIYTDFRPAIVRAVRAWGGSDADGGVFFFVALNEAARQARAEIFPADAPFYFHLKALALAHYRDWLIERNQPAPDILPTPDEPDTRAQVPAQAGLRDTRQHLVAWRAFSKLTPNCQQTLTTAYMPDPSGITPLVNSNKSADCEKALRATLQITDPTQVEVPHWVTASFQDQAGYTFWQHAYRVEKQLIGGDAPPRRQARNSYAVWIILGVFAILIVLALYRIFHEEKRPVEVYKDNFAPPASIMEDVKARYGSATLLDSTVQRPAICQQMLEEADEFYKNKDFEAASETLLVIAESGEELSECQSDAYFYLGLIALQENDPSQTLACFSKIEDLERFGQDIYWYQALAFVKLSQKNPNMRERAHRAVQRAIGNMTDPARRQQAEKMFEDLTPKASD